MQQEILICPFCHTEVPMGVAVCKGCQAEVKYNEVTGGSIFLGMIAGFIALIATFMGAMSGKTIVGLIIGVVLGVIVYKFLVKALKIKTTSEPKFYRQMKH